MVIVSVAPPQKPTSQFPIEKKQILQKQKGTAKKIPTKKTF